MLNILRSKFRSLSTSFFTIFFLTTIILSISKCSDDNIVYALDVTVSSSEITVIYDEPALNSDGTPLTDLFFTTIYVQLGIDTVPIVEDIFSATLTGKAHIIHNMFISTPQDRLTDIDIWVTATDTSGNENIPSPIITRTMDKLAPMSIE